MNGWTLDELYAQSPAVVNEIVVLMDEEHDAITRARRQQRR